jgi:vacuolar-type H+-ATPase subunit H
MPKQTDEIQVLSDEFSRIFEAYRARIDEITRHSQVNLALDVKAEPEPAVIAPQPESAAVAETITPPEPPAVEPQQILDAILEPVAAPGKSPSLSTEPAPEAAAVPLKPVELKPEPVLPPPPPPPIIVEPTVIKESEVILRQARREASRIIAEAEESIKKDARKKTQAQVEKTLAKANREAELIVAKAARHVNEEREQIIAQMKQEAAALLKDITESCRRESRERSSQVIAETRDKAAKMITDVITASEEIGQQLNEIIARAKSTVAEFEEKMQAQTGELTEAVSAAHTRLITLTLPPREPEPEALPAGKNKSPAKKPTLTVRLKDTRPDRKFFHTGLFCGEMEMSSSGGLDYKYVKDLKKYLALNSGVKYLEESASEKEFSMLFEVKDPIPLLDVLNRAPQVEQVLPQPNDDILVVFGL